MEVDDDKCSASNHNFQAHPNSTRIFCTKCGEFRGGSDLQAGIIAMWSGRLQELPEGWNLCDGTRGTPDLRDKFILGAGGGYMQSSEGGNTHCMLTMMNIPAHTHPRNTTSIKELPIVQTTLQKSETAKWVVKTSAVTLEPTERVETKMVTDTPLLHSSTGSAGATEPTPIDLRPPYYALAFIMRCE